MVLSVMISTSNRVPQQDVARIAVILKRGVKGRNGKTAGGGVARSADDAVVPGMQLCNSTEMIRVKSPAVVTVAMGRAA
jgi:hypothetical protein